MHMTIVNEFYSYIKNTHAYIITIQIYGTKMWRESKFITSAAAAAAHSLQGFRPRELFRAH